MKLVLILMVKNESRILERCLKAVEGVVDAYCIHDTGSTDNTCEIANKWLMTHNGCLTHSEWKDFGYNRTQSFIGAYDYVKTTDWDPKTTYGLLLDADMVFHPEKLKEQTLELAGYTVIQVAGHLAYPNTRLVRMDHPWTCRGVTHEYWDGPSTSLPRDICWIEDQNDGGCKSDKFTRDARLLEQGLKDEPENVRYMFYLAQTYHSLGRWKDSIAMYKKRYEAGGWDEERWYSLYMIAQSYLTLGDAGKFESWMLRARAFRPGRAESVYKLAKYFREKGEHYKSYQYVQMGKDIPLSGDSLFIETPVYTGLFEYEATILLYYLDRKQEGLLQTTKYLLRDTAENMDNVYKNMSFYVQPLGKGFRNHPVMRDAAGSDYHPTSVSVFRHQGKVCHNVRFVNYSIDQRNGSYMMKNGDWSSGHTVMTQNVFWDGTTERKMDDGSVLLPRNQNANIRGLEDLRVYTDSKGELRFMATQREYTEKSRILGGIYDMRLGRYRDCEVYEPPTPTECEKNWLPIEGTEDIVYSWHPLQVGQLKDKTLEITTTHPTPWLFRHIRGSAIPFRIDNELWVLTHCVEYSSPRKYFHSMVVLNAKTYKPLRMSLPFSFRKTEIEYCIGMRPQERAIEFVFSSWDDNPLITEIPLESFQWLQL
jgi:glycosyltransferase involved in cell wall biosynthesis